MKIWLVWATNVWKSTLFNRLIGQFRAIVTDIPWTTTDIIQHKVQTDNWSFTFFDSPGLLDFTEELQYIEQIIKQSDLLLFLIDEEYSEPVERLFKEKHVSEYTLRESESEKRIEIRSV